MNEPCQVIRPSESLPALGDDRWQHRGSILLAFPAAHDDLMSIEVHVFHAKLQALLQPQTCAVEQSDDDPHLTVKMLHDLRDFVAAQHDRQPDGRSCTRNVLDPADVTAHHGRETEWR